MSSSPPWGSDQTAPLGPWRSRAPTSTDAAAIDRPYADAAVLPVDAHTVRLFLHVLAATVWVGGQLTLAGLVPGLRTLSPDAPRVVARRNACSAVP